MKRRVVQVFLVILLIFLILIGYWASTEIGNQGAEERFQSAVGLNQSREENEFDNGLSLEAENPFLYIALVLVTLIIGVSAHYAVRSKDGG